MKFTCSRDILNEGLNIVRKAIPSKSNTPVLEGVFIDVGEELILTGSDGDISITYKVESVIESKGKFVVSAANFADIVRKLPDIYVTVETNAENTQLKIDSGNAHFEIGVINADQYPKIDFVVGSNQVAISKADFRNLVRKTAFAASIDNAKMVLRGVLIENKYNMLKFVALDGYRLAMKSVESSCNENFKIVVPANVIQDVAKIVEKGDDMIYMSFSDNQVVFFTDTFKLVSALLNGEYVDYEKLIPSDFTSSMKLKTNDFAESIDRASLVVTDDRKWPITIKTYQDEILIAVAGEKGTSREVVNAEVSGQEIEIFFHAKNILDCVRNVENENIEVNFTSQKGPCVISGENDDSLIMLVMPVKPRIR